MPKRRRPARAVTILAGIAAAGALAAVPTAPASAATGTLTLNGTEHADPYGCYRLAGGSGEVANRTDETVFLLSGDECRGRVVGVLLPGEATSGSVRAGSVFAP